MQKICLAILVVISCTLLAANLEARDEHATSNLLHEFAGQFRPLTEADRLELATEAYTSFQRLADSLNQLNRTKQSTWWKFLELRELQEILESDVVDPHRLRAIERKFYGLTNGLDAAPFVQLRQSLSDYVNFLHVYVHPDLQSEFERRLNLLDDELANSDSLDALQIAQHVDWLIAARQTPDLVKRIQRQFQHPSIVVDVNMKFLLPQIQGYRQDIAQSTFTTNTIVGVPVSGMSHFNASVWPELIENPNHATLRLLIKGKIDSPANDSRPQPQNAPLIGPVSVALKSSATTTVSGYKEIYWDGLGLVAGPSNIQCETDATVKRVAISRKYFFPFSNLAKNVDKQIRKKAYQEVNKKSPAANRESAEIAQRQVSEQLDIEVDAMLKEANSDIDAFYRAPLVGLGVLPMGTSISGPDAIRLGFRGTNFGGIGAALPLREQPMRGDVEVSMHESMCANLWAGFLRGRQVTDFDFRNVHRELRGFVPMALRVSGNQSWSVKLCNETPFGARFRDGSVILQFNVDSITIDDVCHECPFSVSARYQVDPELIMPRFYRDEEVVFQWLKPQLNNPEYESQLREFILAKFDAFFARDMHFDGVSAPVGNEWGTAAEMSIIASEIQDGWWRVLFRAQNLNRLN